MSYLLTSLFSRFFCAAVYSSGFLVGSDRRLKTKKENSYDLLIYERLPGYRSATSVSEVVDCRSLQLLDIA